MLDDSTKKNYNFTTFIENMTQQQFKDVVLSNYQIDKIIIGALEHTESGKEHFHCYVSFIKKVRFDTIKKDFPQSHIEVCFGDIQANYKYCTKEGEPFFVNFDILDYLEKNQKEEKCYNQLMIDIFVNELSFKEILMKYPKFAIYNFNNIKSIYDYNTQLKYNDKTIQNYLKREKWLKEAIDKID